MEQLIVSEEWTLPNGQAPAAGTPAPASPLGGDGKPAKKKRVALPKLSELGRSVVTSYSLKAYVNLLGPQHRHNIASWLYANTLTSLGTIFKSDSGFCLTQTVEVSL